MSHEAVQEILNRALSDPAFRRRLLLEPEAALADYDLTSEEAAALRMIRAEETEEESSVLDERRSKRPGWFYWPS
ncbi:MAG: Franean1_4349 family RiPP [Chloroflexi bacterium]|nr:Franean1_4349 family RiPP [Chloroflexota bacterium]